MDLNKMNARTQAERELSGWMAELSEAGTPAVDDDAPLFVGGMSTREERLRDRDPGEE